MKNTRSRRIPAVPETLGKCKELAVAVAITLFGTASPAALATTVGVLTEVPVMLTLVRIANRAGAEPQGD